jgi:hypothetical protein
LASGVHDVDDVAQLRGCLRERADRVAGGDVDGVGADGVTGRFEGFGGCGEGGRVVFIASTFA